MATESQFTISPWKCAAKLRDKAVLPLPVGPSTTTSSGSQPTSTGTPGNVVPVTREELRQKLWPADTFVDFDHSLNTAVNKVREALGDSASSPRYLETLARRGYRFLAPVESAHSGPKDAGTEPLVTQLNGSPLHP